jgi:glycosyltransferase involved in cell wall biosynthesis
MLVSIITPFFNEERTLPILLQRAAAASLPTGMTREFVLVDDGSRDGSNATAADFVRRNPEVARLITLPSNQGKGAAMRNGLAAALGDILVIQDADLEWDPADYAPAFALRRSRHCGRLRFAPDRQRGTLHLLSLLPRRTHAQRLDQSAFR